MGMPVELRIESIVREFVRVLSNTLRAQDKHRIGWQEPSTKRQVHVDFQITEKDLKLSLDDFAEKFINSAAYALAQRLNNVTGIFDLPLPTYAKSASRASYDRISARVVRDTIRTWRNDGGVAEVEAIRFDVFVTEVPLTHYQQVRGS